MRTSVGRWAAAHRYATERLLAPHVDERWAEQLLLELRLRGVPGHRIGEVLAEVDSHCAESGQDAHEAFGPPVDYARSLELPQSAALSHRETLTVALPMVPQILGMLMITWSADHLFRGTAVAITVGHVVLLALLALQLTAVIRWIDPVLTAVVRRPFVTWCVTVAVVGSAVVALVLLRTVLVTLPGAPLVAAGIALLGVGVGSDVRRRRRSGPDDDPVVPPLPDPGVPSSRSSGADRLARVTGSIATWLLPVATVVLVATSWALARAPGP